MINDKNAKQRVDIKTINRTCCSNFLFQTGLPATFPNGQYEYNGLSIPIYEARNSSRIPTYHRLDVSAKYTPRSNSNSSSSSTDSTSEFVVCSFSCSQTAPFSRSRAAHRRYKSLYASAPSNNR